MVLSWQLCIGKFVNYTNIAALMSYENDLLQVSCTASTSLRVYYVEQSLLTSLPAFFVEFAQRTHHLDID